MLAVSLPATIAHGLIEQSLVRPRARYFLTVSIPVNVVLNQQLVEKKKKKRKPHPLNHSAC